MGRHASAGDLSLFIDLVIIISNVMDGSNTRPIDTFPEFKSALSIFDTIDTVLVRAVVVLGRSKGGNCPPPLDFGFAPPPSVWRATKICVMIVGLMK